MLPMVGTTDSMELVPLQKATLRSNQIEIGGNRRNHGWKAGADWDAMCSGEFVEEKEDNKNSSQSQEDQDEDFKLRRRYLLWGKPATGDGVRECTREWVDRLGW